MSRRPGAAGRRRGLEACKTAIIVLLTASAVLLTLTAARYSGSGWDGLEQLVARIAGQETPPPRKAEEPSHIDAALPLAVTVRGSAGRTSFQGDFAAIDAAFERLGSHLAAALDTAGNAQSIPESELIRAATGNSLCFFYPGDIPLQLLADWLDANAAGLGLSGRDFVLVVRDGTVQLLVGGQDGCWRLETQADAASLADALDERSRGRHAAGRGIFGLQPARRLDFDRPVGDGAAGRRRRQSLERYLPHRNGGDAGLQPLRRHHVPGPDRKRVYGNGLHPAH